MISDYLFKDMATGEDFFVECETREEATATAKMYFEKPRFLMRCNPEDADILGYDTY